MKLIHLSDLHLGKRLNEFSMIEDQRVVLLEILRIIRAEAPDAVILAGDIYDKPVPPGEAVQLLDEFLYQLSRDGLPVLIISGNHDSADRIAFGSRMLEKSGIYLSPVYRGDVSAVSFHDDFGEVRFYLLPFVKPAAVKALLPEEEREGIVSYTDAVRFAISRMAVNPEIRNVLVTHQFVTGAELSESEDIAVGGTDNVDASVFDGFDYVALGHIHSPQSVGRETVRYCGTPLKYSFSEKDQVKSVTVVEMAEKGNVRVRTVPLRPARDLREIRGTYEELTLKSNYEGTATDDYLHVVLTDEQDVPDAVARLRVIYPNLMKLDYDNTRTRTAPELSGPSPEIRKTPLELFAEFYEKQTGHPMSEEQSRYSAALLEKIREEGEA